MTRQVVTINRKKYAAGLFWQPVTPGATPYIYARQLIAKSKKKYTLLTEYKSMIGLCDVRDGARAGMGAIAAEVVNVLSEFVSFLGVFQIDDGFYLIAVRNSVIIQDVFMQSEHDVRKLYVELSNMPDWGGLFAPASWGMPRSKERFLQELIHGSPVTKLRHVSIVKSLAPSIGFIGALALLSLIVVYLPTMIRHTSKPMKINQELLEQYKRQIDGNNVRAEVKVEKKEPAYPYNNLPDVMERAYLCYKAIGFVMQPVGGWHQTKAECGEKYVNVGFYRGVGTLNEFYDVGGEIFPGGVVTQKSNNEFSVRVKLPQLKTHKSIDSRDQETALRDLVSLFQRINFKSVARVANDTIKVDADKTEKIHIINVTDSSRMVPMEYMHLFDGFDGVYIKSINWDSKSKIWNYNVLIYTK